MDTLLFENFLVLAETLSYTKAAEELFKAESVLSRQISKLEHILGHKLFERNNRVVSLTPAGKTLRNGLLRIRKDYTSLIEEMEAIKAGHSGVIKIALSPGVRLHSKMVGIVRSFEKDFPDIHIDLRSYNMGDLHSLLLNQQVDFVYGVIDDFTDNPLFSCEFIGVSKNFLVVPKGHPIAGKKVEELSLVDFKEETFLFFDDQKRAIRHFSKICEEAGFALKYVTADDAGMMMLLVELHRGILISEETNMFKVCEDMAILPLPILGCLKLGIIQNIKNSKECNATFTQYVRERT
jgi:DNA-binding transcriptional LysR family regulator